MNTFQTPVAAALRGADDANGPDERLEDYYSPDQTERVFCTTEEREDFEQCCEIALTADVIEDQADYDALVRFLTETYELR
jgi:hypothetical protein